MFLQYRQIPKPLDKAFENIRVLGHHYRWDKWSILLWCLRLARTRAYIAVLLPKRNTSRFRSIMIKIKISVFKRNLNWSIYMQYVSVCSKFEPFKKFLTIRNVLVVARLKWCTFTIARIIYEEILCNTIYTLYILILIWIYFDSMHFSAL
jgi:hypothetical protein